MLGAIALLFVLTAGSARGAAASPITVTKSASASQIASGSQLTYTIVVKNTGGAAISNVVMTDQVNGVGVLQNPPALPQFQITSSKGSCTQGGANGNLVTCTAGNMAGGESWTVTIGGQVTAGAGTTLNNTATVTGTKSSTTFTTPSNTTSVAVTQGTQTGFPDLTINKTGPTSITPSTPMTYTLTVNNIGNANTANVEVVDTLPSGVTSPTWTTTSLFTCSASAGDPITVSCSGGAVNAGQNATITINATSPALNGTITNTAVVDPNNKIIESNELNNTSAAVNTSVSGSPPPPLLGISLSDSPDPVSPGTKLTYRILVTNNATGNNATANYVSVVDSTQGLDASSITATQTILNGQLAKTDGCVVTAPQVKCTVKALASGGTISITIIGTVVQSAGSSIFDTATVNGNVKNMGVTNTASEATTVRPYIDLNITKGDSPDPVCAASWPVDGSHLSTPASALIGASGTPPPLVQPADCLGGLTYTFVVGNSGIAPATGVVVRDPLPAGAILDSYSAEGGFTCGADASQVVTCTGGTIPAAGTKKITLLVAAPPYAGAISNTVTVDPNNAIFEADETNNTATEGTTVATGVDLVVWKGDNGNQSEDPPGGAPAFTDGFDPIATNGTDTYTIIVDNVGTQSASGIKVVDTLPAGTRFLSVTSDPFHSFTCSSDGAATGGNVTCVGGQLKGTESEFYNAPDAAHPAVDDFATIKIKLFATPFVQPAMHNLVRVDPDNTIPETNELNNSAVDDTVVGTGNADQGAFNQLTIAKTQTSPTGPVATNGVVTYNVHVSNLGTDPVSNVVVKDHLPAGTRFISVADANTASAARFFCSSDGAATGGTLTCTGGDFSGSVNTIPDSPSGTVPTSRDIVVKVFAPKDPGTYTNNVTVDPDNVVPEGNEFDNDSSVDTTVVPCNDQTECTNEKSFYELTIKKTQVSPASPAARNGIITYDLAVANLGTDAVHGVVATDRLPAGFRFINAKDLSGSTDANSFTCSGPDASGVVTCSGGTLDGTADTLGPGVPQSRTIEIRVFAPDTPGTYTNTAFVDPGNTIPEGNEFNNQSSVDTVVANGGNGPYIDLKVVKTQVFPDPGAELSVPPGGGISYQLHVTNSGAGDAFNVTVADAIPQHVTFHNARDGDPTSAGAFSCAFASGQLTCTGGTIPAGGARDIFVNVTADPSIDKFALDQADVHITVTNQAIVDPGNTIPEGDETNNTSSVDTLIKPRLDLTLESQGPGNASQNTTTTYTITAHNVTKYLGGGTAHDVVITDSLPAGLIPLNVQADPGNFICDLQENPVNKVTCIGDLPAGGDVTITISAFITLESGDLDNEACIDVPQDAIAETDETNNCKTNIGQAVPFAPDLQINKTASEPSVTAGEALKYTLTVSNVGTADTTGDVVVTDNVPSDVHVDQVEPPAGWDCGATVGNNVSCTTPQMAAGDSASIFVDTTVGSSLSGPITNTAQVSGGGDIQDNNNSSTVKTLVGSASAIDLQVKSLTDSPDPVNHDNKLTYTAVVVNNGTSGTGPNTIVRVVLPAAGVPVASMAVSANNSFTCAANMTVDPSGTTFDCLGAFGASGTPTGSTTVTATMTVASDAPPPTELSATVTVDPDNTVTESDETNNTLTEKTSVSGTVCGGSPCVDLLALISGPAIVPSFGSLALYTATVTNAGTTPVPDSPEWTVMFSYPLGLITSVAPGGPNVTCMALGSLASCHGTAGTGDAMDLAPGATISFVVNAIDNAPPGGAATMEVNADSGNQVTELTKANNTNFAVTATAGP